MVHEAQPNTAHPHKEGGINKIEMMLIVLIIVIFLAVFGGLFIASVSSVNNLNNNLPAPTPTVKA